MLRIICAVAGFDTFRKFDFFDQSLIYKDMQLSFIQVQGRASECNSSAKNFATFCNFALSHRDSSVLYYGTEAGYHSDIILVLIKKESMLESSHKYNNMERFSTLLQC